MPDGATLDQVREALELLTSPAGAPSLQALDPTVPAAIEAEQQWLRGPGVVGYGVGPKSDTDATPALRVYVERKRPVSQLRSAQTVPTALSLPIFDSHILTDVLEIGLLELQTAPAAKTRPLAPGCSIGLVDGETGTLGCFVTLVDQPDQRYILSNAHVLAASGLAAAGSAVAQPGPRDGGTATDTIGHLTAFVPLVFSPGFDNLCDAAIAEIDPDVPISDELPAIGAVKRDVVAPAIGMQVQIFGRSSGRSAGTVQDVDFRTFLDYPKPGGGFGAVGFRSQVLSTRYSEPGDSGSVVWDMDGNPVGLHWAGSASASIFSPFSFVADALKIRPA